MVTGAKNENSNVPCESHTLIYLLGLRLIPEASTVGWVAVDELGTVILIRHCYIACTAAAKSAVARRTVCGEQITARYHESRIIGIEGTFGTTCSREGYHDAATYGDGSSGECIRVDGVVTGAPCIYSRAGKANDACRVDAVVVGLNIYRTAVEVHRCLALDAFCTVGRGVDGEVAVFHHECALALDGFRARGGVAAGAAPTARTWTTTVRRRTNLFARCGGTKAFSAKLDDVFAQPPHFDNSYYGQTIHEIREMQIMNMGNYAHGNQPIQHMIYLYSYANEPWKAQYWVRQVMNKLYMATPDGYCGDEDNGQTSAWYVFSALGFYPVCSAGDQYVLGTPLFKKATINLENGNKVVIKAPNNSAENIYVKSMFYNGKNYTKNYLDYNSLIKGAVINVTMDSKPNKTRGVTAADLPYSFSTAK